MTTPWAPPHSAAAPPQPAQPSAPHRAVPGLGRALAAFSALLLVAIAITAITTAAIVKSNAPSQLPPPTAEQRPTAAEQQAAKDRLCRVFDDSSSGRRGKGGAVVNGEPNTPVLLRTVISAVSVDNALTPAVPADVQAAAREYSARALDMALAGTGDAPVDEVNRLTQESNRAAYSLADACGLPR